MYFPSETYNTNGYMYLYPSMKRMNKKKKKDEITETKHKEDFF